ncbi:MAG: DUF1287 domain-containing protein [bacterium]|nr:DUF1287 domain-containing protein [bacterium]
MKTGSTILAPRRRRLTLLSTWVAVVVAGAAAGQPPAEDHARKLVAAAIARANHTVVYDGSYRRIAYPGGDVPAHVGVCTDVVIRAYRALGIDLQRLVHEDMARDFSAYPDRWGHTRPDPNIDHRRVPNLRVFFARHGTALPTTRDPADYRAGDLVTWTIPGNLPHIGIVVDRRSADGERPLVVHNIGAGPEIEDMLFAFPVTGHYRFDPNGAPPR